MVRLKFGTDQIVSIAAHVSGVITLVLLIVIILYHMYSTFCSKCLKCCRFPNKRHLDDSELCNDVTFSTENCSSKPTFSVVELKQPDSDDTQHSEVSESDHCQVSRVKSKANDDSISLDSTSPLLKVTGYNFNFARAIINLYTKHWAVSAENFGVSFRGVKTLCDRIYDLF